MSNYPYSSISSMAFKTYAHVIYFVFNICRSVCVLWPVSVPGTEEWDTHVGQPSPVETVKSVRKAHSTLS